MFVDSTNVFLSNKENFILCRYCKHCFSITFLLPKFYCNIITTRDVRLCANLIKNLNLNGKDGLYVKLRQTLDKVKLVYL